VSDWPDRGGGLNRLLDWNGMLEAVRLCGRATVEEQWTLFCVVLRQIYKVKGLALLFYLRRL
jgi:hypothetical protein